MKKLLAIGAITALVCFPCPMPGADMDNKQEAKKALQELNDYIGAWKGNGSVEKNARETWKETIKWGWRFKKDDVFLTVNIAGGRFFKGGQLRYLVDKKRYQFRALDKDGKEVVFEGPLTKGRLLLERFDKDKNETQQLKMNLAASGVRFVYTFSHKPANRTLFTGDFQVAFTKDGESFAAKEKKVECIVSGGLGTMAVTYKGVTYYVCCSGCRDAFNEEPEKYIKEYEAKQKKN
jgi:hypothetical protein